MKVCELLEAYNDHVFIDVHISQELYDCSIDNDVTVELATWKHKEHKYAEWYLGGLDYFDDEIENALLQYMDCEVAIFFIVNTLELNKLPQMYIVIK